MKPLQFSNRRPTRSSSRRRRHVPCVQLLEQRVLLSNTYTVTNTLDDGSVGSLRWAIEQVDHDTGGGADTIDFNISGTGPFVIRPTTPLPAITNPVLINGYSQPGSSPNAQKTSDNAVLQIVLDGSQFFGDGLEINAPGCTVQGLVIDNSDTGVYIDPGGSAVIRGNFIGTDATGSHSADNYTGVDIEGSTSSTVGGTTLAARNVIAGNLLDEVTVGYQSSAVVQGNFLGVGASGSSRIGSYNPTGVYVSGNSPNTLIGGAAPGAGNVIVDGPGIQIDGGAVVQGNRIGTDATGTVALGSFSTGVDVYGSGNTIGGTALGAGNVISGNGTGITLDINSSTNLVEGNLIGTDVTGAAPLANSTGIDVEGMSNTIGGTVHGAGNVISSNHNDGISVNGFVSQQSQTVIQGNWIGTDATETLNLGNGGDGVGIGDGASGDTVGGLAPARGTSSRTTAVTASRSGIVQRTRLSITRSCRTPSTPTRGWGSTWATTASPPTSRAGIPARRTACSPTRT